MRAVEDGNVLAQRNSYARAATFLKVGPEPLQQGLYIRPADIVAGLVAEKFLQRLSLFTVHT